MKLAFFSGLVFGLGLATASLAQSYTTLQPNLTASFNVNTGAISVTNTGSSINKTFYVSIECQEPRGGACPEPKPAQIAPYQHAAIPNAAAIKVKGLGSNKTYTHVLPFYASLDWAPGKYTLRVCADPTQAVNEANYSDNCSSVRKLVRDTSFTTRGLKPVRNGNRLRIGG
jgi:hypothetical protein